MYQMSVKGASKWAYFSYARKTNPASCVTKITSTEEKNGKVEWNQMVFTSIRPITSEEATLIFTKAGEIKDAADAEKEYYSSVRQDTNNAEAEAKEEFKNF